MSVARLRIAQVPIGKKKFLYLDETNERASMFTSSEQEYINEEKEQKGVPGWEAPPEEWDTFYWRRHNNEKLGKYEDLSFTLNSNRVLRLLREFYLKIFCQRRHRPEMVKERAKKTPSKQKEAQWMLGPVKWFTNIRPVPKSTFDKPTLSLKQAPNEPCKPNSEIQRNQPLELFSKSFELSSVPDFLGNSREFELKAQDEGLKPQNQIAPAVAITFPLKREKFGLENCLPPLERNEQNKKLLESQRHKPHVNLNIFTKSAPKSQEHRMQTTSNLIPKPFPVATRTRTKEEALNSVSPEKNLREELVGI